MPNKSIFTHTKTVASKNSPLFEKNMSNIIAFHAIYLIFYFQRVNIPQIET